MPNRFAFTSPGNAATEELTRILAEREQQRRQAFLDSITLKRENRNDEIQRANLDEVKLRNEALNDERQQRMATGVAGLMKPGQRIDAATTETLKKGNLGMLVKPNQQFTPEGDTETAGTMDIADQFAGTPDQLKKQSDEKRQADYIASLDPNSPEAKALQYEQMTGKQAPAGMFDKTKGTIPVMRVNPRTGQMESLGDAPAGTHFVSEPAPPVVKSLGPDAELTPPQLQAALNISGKLKSHPMYTDMVDIASGLQGVEVGITQKNGFGDIVAMNALQRMVDPGATVRESDIALLRSASSWLQKIFSEYPIERLRAGAQLPEAVRQQMKKASQDLYAVRSKNYNNTVGQQYRMLARGAGVPFEYVGQDFPDADAASTAPAGSPGGPAGPPAPATAPAPTAAAPAASVAKWGRDANGRPVRLQ